MRLPAERRVGLTHTDRGVELAGHRRRIALDEREQVRQAAGTGELETVVGSLLQDGARLREAVERQQ